MEFNPKGVVIGMAMPPDLTVPTYDQLRATVARLEWELAMANDAALKGAAGRATGTAYEECQKELAAVRADLETALNEMGKDDKELEYLNEQLDILRGKVRGWKHDIGRAKAYPDNAERLLTVIETEMREAVGVD